jgi:uncharacterized protein (TIGR04255 family)
MPAQRAFRDLLGAQWVIESQKVQQFGMALGPGAPGSASVSELVVPRFTLRDRTVSVAIAGPSVTIETTNYRHYPDFRSVLSTVFDAVVELLAPDGVTRLGLRYIDEIRVPGMDPAHAKEWREWLDPSLLAPGLDPMRERGYEAVGWDGVAHYATGVERSLVLRYGARQGYAVQPRGTLSRPTPPPPGPYFVLDFDSFWEPADIPAFDAVALVDECDELRRPVRGLFDLLVTDRLRTEVFMREPANG